MVGGVQIKQDRLCGSMSKQHGGTWRFVTLFSTVHVLEVYKTYKNKIQYYCNTSNVYSVKK